MSLKELSQVVPVIRILSKNNLVFHQFRYTSTLIRNHGMYDIRDHIGHALLNSRSSCSYLYLIGHKSHSRFYSKDEHSKKNELPSESSQTTAKDDSKFSSATSPDPESPDNKKLSLFQKIKIMYRDYWYILAPVHLVTSAFWFGSFYYLAKSGIDIVAVMKMLGFSETLTSKLEQGHSTSAYLALAYALYKIATPLRYTVTLGGTTYSINKLKELGYIKPIPPKEKLVEMYEEKKEQLKEKSDQIKERIQDNKVMIRERYQDNKALLQQKISSEKCKMSLKRDNFLTTWRSNPKARQNGNGNTRQNGSKKVNGSQNGTKKINGSSKGNGSNSKER